MIGPKLTPPTARERLEAYELATFRDHDVCQRCRRDCGPTARDHRRNRSQGGQTVVENLQVLGLGCHQWKTEHPDSANRDGWGVPAWASPADYPAQRWVRTGHGTLRLAWVLYEPAEDWGDGPGFVEITDDEARSRRAGLWQEEH